jgi:hypothetical protein
MSRIAEKVCYSKPAARYALCLWHHDPQWLAGQSGRGSNVWESPRGQLAFSFKCALSQPAHLIFVQYLVSLCLVKACDWLISFWHGCGSESEALSSAGNGGTYCIAGMPCRWGRGCGVQRRKLGAHEMAQ